MAASNADRIRALEARGWTQRQIAQAIGRSPSYVSRVARGKTPGRLITEAVGKLGRAPGRRGTVPNVEAPRRLRATGETARVRGTMRRGLEPVTDRPRLYLPVRGTPAEIVTEGVVHGVSWHLGGWRDASGVYTDTSVGGRLAGNPGPPSLESVAQATIFVEGVGYRVVIGPFDDEFSLEDAAREAAEFYGVGSAE
jgi:hypothetical protein